MKRILLLCLVLFSFSTLTAQEKSGVKSVIGASASKKDNLGLTLTKPVNGVSTRFTISSVSIQAGMPYMGLTKGTTANPASTQTYTRDLGFPWGIRYRYTTFSEDAFTVSKGYFSDRIEINWDIKKNQEKITNITVYRTEDVTNASPNWGKPLKTLAGDVGTFSDTNVEGGKLYRYKIFAKGVEVDGLEIIYSNFITGIGYRNPTGVITGNIAYTGGNPVKDVMITANPTGSTLRFGSSLNAPINSYISVPNLHKGLQDSITLQAWIKPTSPFANDEMTTFNLMSSGVGGSFPININFNNNALSVNIIHNNISLNNYIPSGEIDNKGDDILVPINTINSAFTHFSFVLRNNQMPEIYINGRLINVAYVAKMNAILDQNPATASATITYTNNNTPVQVNYETGKPTWNGFRVGGKKSAYFDELRVWETALSPAQIKRDFRRYLKGNEAYLNTYIKANEKSGDYAYDLAQTGLNFHGNDATLSHSPVRPTWANSEDNINNIPTNSQLGVLGVTDEYGNYVISSVPYSGNGDSFTIVPSLGKHEFNPPQELAFLGPGSTVVNDVDFIDKSSFVFRGLVVYDSREVFPSITGSDITGDIKDDETYNAYVKGNLKYQKGQYWAEKNDSGTILRLKRYATIPVPGAYVSIDNVQAIDANNVPIQTDLDGRFTIEVPIGKHAINISKSGHTFDLDGRYPARTRTIVNRDTTYINTYQDFFEDRDEPITFIDTTKVTVIGRVVGGTKEAEKTIGFGFDGTKTYRYTGSDSVDRSIVYTSRNNIGKASITLGYIPRGATTVTPEYRANFETNSQTGEYRVKLLPLTYQLAQNDLMFPLGRNPDNSPLLSAGRTINFTTIKAMQYPKFVQGDTTITGKPYQEILKFTHFARPIYTVLSQTSDTQILANGTNYTIAANQETPIYTQFGNYSIQIQGQERYTNFDTSPSVVDTVPVQGGSIIATNSLALANSEKTVVSATDPSILIYTFRGGIPNTDAASAYKRSIDLRYRLNGMDTPLQNYKTDGIILGGVADGTQTFVTAGPELPDFVLRDPPGSNSSATIEKGSSFSFTKENSSSENNSSELNGKVSLGFKLSLGGGLAGPVMETEVKNDVSSGITMAQSSSNGESVTNTYTFNQTISTSDDPDWVGSDADLYVGTSANQYYGTYNDLVATTTAQAGRSPIRVIRPSNSNTNITQVFPKINTALYFNEAPEKTLFVYSQRNILNDLIPKYLEFIRQIDAGTLIANTNGVLSRNAYQSSVNLWRKIILNNELAKYQALNSKDQLKTSLNAIIESLKDPKTNTLSASAKQLKNLLNATFYENISIDAGVGGFTKGYQVERLTSSSLSYSLQLDASIALAFGASFNDTGFEMDTKTNSGSGSESSSQDDSNTSTNISYTLKDTDKGNLLSVDVINAFDGNGPIFITKGGETSCPYEGPELSHFYNPTHPNVTSTTASIVNLSEDLRKPLSIATIPLELPEMNVVASNVSGVFEGRNAEFVLRLRNTSTVRKDATFKLSVDQSTNPNNALINIEPNGTLINIPAGQTVLYTMTLKKVKQDQFDYPNVRVLLESTCDENAVDSVLVSANFIPACSPVSILSPSNNWLLNRNTAYNGTSTSPVNIKLGGYNTTFASFEKINLEYRLKGTPNWIGLRTFFKNQSDKNAAVSGGDPNVEVIVGNALNFAWDIAALGLANGSYELRARTTCSTQPQTAYESEIIEGKVDLTSPVLFGTPTPKNGILNLGDDITLRFNEPVKTNGTATLFEFKVQKNQLPVKHEVSLAFNGTTNTATIAKPALSNGDFSIEFWLKNASPNGTSTLLDQTNGIKIELIDSQLKYSFGNQSKTVTILKDNAFNYYALSYEAATKKLSIIENGTDKGPFTLTNPANFSNENPITIGGNTFKGNLHDLRFWKKYISIDMAIVNKDKVFNGNELGLLGYWPMNEGNGLIANDLARFKHLALASANWDIFPKGTSYNLDGSNYLRLDSVSKVIISKEMDATLSFWMRSSQTTTGTLLSNGTDNNDPIQSNGYRNKWSINLNTSGRVELIAETKTFAFGSPIVNDNSWHHIAMSLTRNGTVRMYVDGNETASYPSTDLGGFNSSIIRLGTQSVKTGPASYPLVNYFNGQMDELCIWNMARTAEQIKADRYFELDFNTTGLLLYANFNKPEGNSNLGPKYYYPKNAFEKASTYAGSLKVVSYEDITPGIKPFRPTESLVVEAVINGDEIILKPQITDWASVEGKVADITVSKLNDMADNPQASGVTWQAFINKNPTKWFVEGQGEIVNLMKRSNENLTFEITMINQGGVPQPYTIDAPTWLTLSAKSGTLAPNTTVTIKATVDNNLAIGDYNTIISLSTNYNYNKKIQLDLRVLEKEPILDLDPSKFSESMNVIAKVKLNGIFTDDLYDKVVAIVNGEVRGSANLVFDKTFNEYFVFLTIYSNTTSTENVMFYIWDASDGKLKEATLNDNLTIPYVQDDIIGTYTIPAIIANTTKTGQQISFNQGWTWTSFNVTDPRFSNLNALTTTLSLNTSDLIQSNSPALFDAYQYNALDIANNGWFGSVSNNGGIRTNKMYKIKLSKEQKLNIKGVPVDLTTWSINLNQNWNWLPFVVSKNIPIGDALANYKASDGDLIKSQSAFAIYSTNVGWKGSLTYLKVGEGYMVKTNTPQTFSYPEYLNRFSASTISSKGLFKDDIKVSSLKNETIAVPKDFANFASTMSAIVKLPVGYQDLAFYNESGQLRGISKTQNIQGEELAFITIFGNMSENLIAHIGFGSGAKVTNKIISFTPDAILGSISKPIIIEFPEDEISVFPNPFDKDFEIIFKGSDVGDAVITVYSMFQQKISESAFKVEDENRRVKIQANVLPGVYILQVQFGDKKITKKIIKN